MTSLAHVLDLAFADVVRMWDDDRDVLAALWLDFTDKSLGVFVILIDAPFKRP